MLTRVFLAAGVAALAITAPASAGPGGGHGKGGGGEQPAAGQGGGEGGGHGHGGGGAPAFVEGGGGGHGHGRGGGGGSAPTFIGGGGGGGHGRGREGGFQAPQQRMERQQARGFERQRARGFERQQARGFERQRARGVERQQARGFERQRSRGFEHQQGRAFARHQGRGFERQQGRMSERQQARTAERQQMRGNRAQAFANEQMRGNGAKAFANQQLRGNGAKAFANQQFNGQLTAQTLGGAKLNGRATAQFANQQFVQQNWDPNRFSVLSFGENGRVLPVTQVEQFVGEPISAVPAFAALSPLPTTIQYLYPDTADYYYRYGDGYLYQVDRTDNLIAALIPLLAGGFLPGQYLPASYMTSYVPDYYGFDAFYPDDYGYGDLCNRYYYGVIYQVDCYTGMVENVIPVYAGGYGVGQLLPSAYTYYNVPVQYRDLYYNTADYGYWYSPGAIYQYDPRSSLITSVAALMSPGFTIGQPLPVGYDVYNVPYAYRATYYDTPSAWYRYNNGYIYQVNPATQLVTAIVASLLT